MKYVLFVLPDFYPFVVIFNVVALFVPYMLMPGGILCICMRLYS